MNPRSVEVRPVHAYRSRAVAEHGPALDAFLRKGAA
jgi:hypothetical protein